MLQHLIKKPVKNTFEDPKIIKHAICLMHCLSRIMADCMAGYPGSKAMPRFSRAEKVAKQVFSFPNGQSFLSTHNQVN